MKKVMTRPRALIVGGALLAGALTATAGTATAAPQPSGDTAVSTGRAAAVAAPSATAASYTVNVWARVNHRTGPHTASSLIGTLGTGNHAALCWTYGDTVTAEGVTHNIWIKVYNYAAEKWGYSSGIYFTGDKRGNLPLSAQC